MYIAKRNPLNTNNSYNTLLTAKNPETDIPEGNKNTPLLRDLLWCALYSVLIVFGLRSSVVTIFAFFLVLGVFILSPIQSIARQLLFLLSFANIFKTSANSTSFFTILTLAAALILLIKKPSFRTSELFAFLAFAATVFLSGIVNSNLQFTHIIKLLASILFILQIKDIDISAELKGFVIMFSLGLLLSSLLAYSGIYGEIINKYIVTDSLYEVDRDIKRFSGLSADCNYYSINLYIAMVGILVLHSARIFKSTLLCFSALAVFSFFGLMTYSKSFYLMIFIIYIYILFVYFQQRKYAAAISLVVLSLVVLLLISSGKIQLVNIFLQRLESADSINDLTTNRFDLWSNYLNHSLNTPIAFIFGGGLDRGNFGFSGSHNTYIETFACLGVVGCTISAFLLHFIMAPIVPIKRKLGNYALAITIVVMYFFLGMLTWVDMPFHLFLCYCFLNLPLKSVTDNS